MEASLSNGAGSFMSNPTSVLLIRKERSRAGSGVILSTPRQSVCPLTDMNSGTPSAARTASAVTVPRNSSCVRVTGLLRGVRACIWKAPPNNWP